MNHDAPPIVEPLSLSGQARQQAMRDELARTMRTVHAARRRRRRGLASMSLVIIGGAITWAIASTGSPPPEPVGLASTDADTTSPTEPAARRDAVELVRVTTRPGTADRYRPASSGHSIIRVDDHSLLQILEEMDRPTGLVRSPDRVWLTADVVDTISEEVPEDTTGAVRTAPVV